MQNIDIKPDVGTRTRDALNSIEANLIFILCSCILGVRQRLHLILLNVSLCPLRDCNTFVNL